MKQTPIPAFLIAYSDSDFTNPHEVVLPDEPQDCRGRFTHMGAMYWGFETRRHKATTVLAGERAFSYDHNAHEWLVIGLKQRAEIDRVSVSTKWYTGNQVRSVSVSLADEVTGRKVKVLDRVPLNPDSDHEFSVPPTIATEALVECYYDGGIARIGFFGAASAQQVPERANILDGAAISHVSNDHYGKPSQAVAGVRAEMHMVGWESARTGFGERALFHLKQPEVIGEIVVDTYLHRLNPPLSSHVYGISGPADVEAAMAAAPRWKLVFEDNREIIPEDFGAYMREQSYLSAGERFKIKLHLAEGSPWVPILPFAPLSRDTYHRFRELETHSPVTHVLYMHYPNGGIHGLKMFAAPPA
jgi:allantoicase